MQNCEANERVFQLQKAVTNQDYAIQFIQNTSQGIS